MKIEHKNSKRHPDGVGLVKDVFEIYNQDSVNSAWKLIQKVKKDYPNYVIVFYLEAVFFVEDAFMFGEKEKNRRYQKTAKTLRRLLFSVRSFTPT